MRIFLVLLFVLSLVGCKKKEVVDEIKYPIHIISKYFRDNKEIQKRYNEGDTSVVPPPTYA